MKINNIHSLLTGLLLVILLSGCLQCEDCEPIDNEPYVRLAFYSASNLNEIPVAIRFFNGQPAGEMSYYQDTTSSRYLMPLSMWSDSSKVVLTYSSSANYTVDIVDTLHIAYERKVETTPKNIVKMINFDLQILEHTFDSLALVCKDTVEICDSNESTLKLYF